MTRLLFVGVPHPAALPDLPGAEELVVLATCSRTELYAVVADVDDARIPTDATARTDDDAVLHLCRVAAGLDSVVLGEPEILGQVRAAVASGSSGPLLDRLFAAAVHAGRRVRSETALGQDQRSLADVSVEIATEELTALAGRRAVVVGTGALAKAVVDRFRAAGCELVVVGRALERAALLAERCGGRAAELAALRAELAGAAVLVSCTRSPHLVVTAGHVPQPLLVLDLARPHDVDPAVAAVSGCRLYDLDAVERRAAASRRLARSDEPAAEAIAAEEARRFCDWRRSRDAATAIASLRGRAETIRAAELARAGTKLAALSPEQRRAVETVTAQIVGKLLHEPTVRLKRESGRALVPVLRELFALEDAA